MNEIQRHLVTLLQEIDEICSKNGIPYILGGRTAKDACQNKNFLGEYMYASVMMRGQDFETFRALVQKKEGRAIESVRENPSFPGGMAMRYVDETTTFLYGDSAHNYRCKGIYVTIQKCRNIPKNKVKAKLANGIEKAIDFASISDLSGLSGNKYRAVMMLRQVSNIFGKAFVVNTLLNMQELLVRKNSSYLAYVRPMKDNINLPATMFTNTKRVEFGGASFTVPAEIEKYLEQVYGKKWKEDKKPEDISAKHLLVASTLVSYKDIDTDASLYANREEIISVIENRKTLTAQIKTLRTKIESYWDILFLTQERYRLYRQYRPVLDILHQRLENKEYTWLGIAMQDYITTVKTYLAKGWPVVVCPELDDLVLAMLEQAGNLGAVKNFEILKNSTKLKAIRMELDQASVQESMLKLPATISVDANGGIPVVLRDGDKVFRVVRLDAEGGEHPLLIKKDDNVVCAPVGVELMGAADDKQVNVWNIALVGEDGTSETLFGSKRAERLFGQSAVLPLEQYIYGQELKIAWLAADETVYVTGKFGTADQYQEIAAPVYCSFNSALEVPVSFQDEQGVLREVFCLAEDGKRAPVVKLGAGGVFWITPEAGTTMHYLNDKCEAEKLDVSRYVDDASNDVKQTLFQEKISCQCCKLVQQDVFGRVFEIAALYDDESVKPLVRMNADGTLTALPEQMQNYSTLCLTHSDGTTTTLATIDADGKIVTSIPAQQLLPVGVIVTRPLTRYQTYLIGGSDGDASFHTTGYAL